MIFTFVFHTETAMKLPVSFGSLLALAGPCIAIAATVNFDDAKVGALPPGWTIAMTHHGGAPRWEVLQDDSAPSKRNVLAQVSNDRTAGRFPLAIWDGASVKDGAVSVKFKTVSGSIDQGAGLVWRYRDPDNYYIVRANALEDNVVLYKVQNGERISLAPNGAVSKAYGVKHRIPKQTWTTLSVEFHGSLFSVSLDGQKLFDVEDSTFAGAGKTGLWTKSDSVIYFDDFEVVGKG
jgi:hypothetical protein